MTSKPADVWFYHLERQPLERVLPSLVEKTLQRGWRAVIQAGTAERLEALDLALWTYSEDSFLPHGTAKAGSSAEQPVFLTTGPETPNGAGVRFLVEGAQPQRFDGAERLIFMFDGNDSDAVAAARTHWTQAKSAGCSVAYWQQTETGSWTKKA